MRRLAQPFWIVVFTVTLAGCAVPGVDEQTSTDEVPTEGAVALLQVDPGIAAPRLGGTRTIPVALLDSFLSGQVARIKDRSVLETALTPEAAVRMVNELDFTAQERTFSDDRTARQRADRIRDSADRLLGAGGPVRQAEQLRKRLRVRRITETTLIAVQLEGGDRQLIADLVNSVVDAYMLDRKAERTVREARRMLGLRRQLADVEARLAAARNEMDVFRRDRGGVRRLGSDVTLRQLEELQTRRTQAQLELIAAQLEAARLSETGESKVVPPDIVAGFQADPLWVKLRAAQVELRAERAALHSAPGADAGKLKAIEARLALLADEIRKRETELRDLALAQQKAALEERLAGHQQALVELSSIHDRAFSQALDEEKAAIRFNELECQHEALRSERDVIRNAITQGMIESEVRANNVTILRPARVPAP